MSTTGEAVRPETWYVSGDWRGDTSRAEVRQGHSLSTLTAHGAAGGGGGREG